MKSKSIIIACAVAIGWFLLTVSFFGVVPSFMQGAMFGYLAYVLCQRAGVKS